MNLIHSRSFASAAGAVQRKFLIVAGVLGVLIVALTVQHRVLKNRADASVAAIKAKGFPINLAELDLSYSVTQGATNAANFYNQAFGAMIDFDRNSTNAPHHHETNLGAPYSQGMMEFLESWIATNQTTIQLLHDGAKHPSCRYLQDYNAGFNTLLPHLARVKASAQLLSWDAVLRAESDDFDGAIRSLESAVAVADSLTNEPDVIAQLVRIAGYAIVNNRLEEILNRHSFNDAQLIRLRRLFEGRESPGNLRIAFAGELCMGLDAFTDPDTARAALPLGTGMGSTILLDLAVVGLKSGGLWERDRNFFVDIHTGYIEALEHPFPAALKEAERVDDRFDAEPGGLANYISRMVLAPMGAVIEKEALRVASLRMTQTVIAIERYRLALDGRAPESLDELTPAFLPSVLPDPFDGLALRYRRLEKGYVVYSISRDKEDNGGDLEPGDERPKDDRFRILR